MHDSRNLNVIARARCLNERLHASNRRIMAPRGPTKPFVAFTQSVNADGHSFHPRVEKTLCDIVVDGIGVGGSPVVDDRAITRLFAPLENCKTFPSRQFNGKVLQGQRPSSYMSSTSRLHGGTSPPCFTGRRTSPAPGGRTDARAFRPSACGWTTSSARPRALPRRRPGG